MEAKEIRKELEENYGYTFVEKDEWQFNFIMGLITDINEVVKKNALLADVSVPLPSISEMEEKRKVLCDRIKDTEHRFGFGTGFDYCYEWITQTGTKGQ